MQVVLNVKGSSRTTGSGHNREPVVALYRCPLVQVPLYFSLGCPRLSQIFDVF